MSDQQNPYAEFMPVERRYFSDWFETALEERKGISFESILRLGCMEALSALGRALMSAATPIPTDMRFEQESNEGEMRVVLIVKTKEPQE